MQRMLLLQNDPKIKNVTKWVAVPPFGLFLAGIASPRPPKAYGTILGPKNGQEKKMGTRGGPGPLLGAALKDMLHWFH